MAARHVATSTGCSTDCFIDDLPPLRVRFRSRLSYACRYAAPARPGGRARARTLPATPPLEKRIRSQRRRTPCRSRPPGPTRFGLRGRASGAGHRPGIERPQLTRAVAHEVHTACDPGGSEAENIALRRRTL